MGADMHMWPPRDPHEFQHKVAAILEVPEHFTGEDVLEVLRGVVAIAKGKESPYVLYMTQVRLEADVRKAKADLARTVSVLQRIGEQALDAADQVKE